MKTPITIIFKKKLISNPHTTLNVLGILAKDPNKYVREYLAFKTTNPIIQNILVNDENYYVRCGLASNSFLHLDIQEILAHDRNFYVALHLAKNQKISHFTKLILAKNEQVMNELISENETLTNINYKYNNTRKYPIYMNNLPLEFPRKW